MKSLTLILSVFVFSFFTTAEREPVSKQLPGTTSNNSVMPLTTCGITLEPGFNDAPRSFTSSGTWVTGYFGMQPNYDMPGYYQQFYGTLDVDCRPSTEVSISQIVSGYPFWINIKTDGKIYLSFGNQGFIPAGTFINFSGISFSK